MKKIISLIILMMILIPFNVEAKDYNVIVSFFAEGGKENTGNIEVYNNLVFEKDTYNAEVSYKSTDTINYINSLDKKTTFTLKKNNKAQTNNKEWYSKKYTDDSKVYFSNSKKYKVSDIIKSLEIDTDYYTNSGDPVDVFLYANYSNTSVKNVAVKSIKLNANSKEIKVGETYTVKATITPSDATDKDITWKSSNTDIATVDSNGKVKGIDEGKATITATTKDGNKIDKITIIVDEKGSKVFTQSSMNLYEDTYYNMNKFVDDSVSSVTWSSSDKKIAEVYSNGVIHGKKTGTVEIIAKTTLGKDKIKVKVKSQTNNKNYNLSNCSPMDVKTKGTPVKLYNCLSDIKLTNPDTNKKLARQIQGIAITDKYIYFSAPLNGSRLYESNGTINNTDAETEKKITTVYYVRVPKNSKTMEYMKVEYAGHGQGIDTIGDNKLYINLGAKLLDHTSELGETNKIVRSTQYRGIGITDFEGEKNKAKVKHPGRVLSVKLKSDALVLKTTSDFTENNKFSEKKYYNYLKKIAKSSTSYRGNPQTSVDDDNNRVAVRNLYNVLVYNKAEFRNGTGKAIYKFRVEDRGTQGDELYGKYFYTLTGGTDVTIKKYDITTGTKVAETYVTFKEYLKDNGYIFIEPEGMSIHNGKIYIGLVMKSCKVKEISSCNKKNDLLRYNSIVKVTGI